MKIVNNRVDSFSLAKSLSHYRVLEFLYPFNDANKEDDEKDEKDKHTEPECNFVLKGKFIRRILDILDQ